MDWLSFALLSAVFTAVITFLEKKQTAKQHSLEFSSAYSVINVLISLPLLLFLSPTSLEAVALIFVSSMLGTVALWFWIKSLRRGDLSVVSPLINLNPVVVAILAYVFLGESLTRPQLGGITLILIGSYMLESRSHQRMLDPFRKIARAGYAPYVILSVILYAVAAIFDKIILYKTSPISYLVLLQIFMAIEFLFLISYRYNNGLYAAKSAMKNWRSISLISFFTVLNRLAILFAISSSFVSLVMPVRRLSSLLSVIIGGYSLKEKGIDRKLIATIVMIIGLYLIVA